MTNKEESFKRLTISRGICSQLEGIVKGVLLGGSMGYGQNYSVNKDSDIDIVIVCDKDKIANLKSTSHFSDSISKDVLQIFQDGMINMFWVSNKFDNVEVNSFIYETEGYKKFCNIEGDIKGYIPLKLSETQKSYGFDGKILNVRRNVRSYKDGFLYEKPALVEGKYWGGPPRSDFLIKSSVLSQKDHFFDFVREDTWNATLKQLVKEYGPKIDLNHANIINTNFTYQRNPERIPFEVVDKVKWETEYRLKHLEKI